MTDDKSVIVVDDEGEDEVEQEFPIFLSKQLSQLYQVQFPLRPSNIGGFSSEDNITARFKRKFGTLELTCELDTECSSYNKVKGQLMASTMAGQSSSTNDDSYKNHVFIGSSQQGQSAGSYAVGIMHNGQIHLNPLSGSIQMRASFSHLNKESNQQTDKETDVAADSATDSEAEGVGSPTQTIRVKFKREETAWAKKRREQSSKHRQKMTEEEKWLTLDYKLPKDISSQNSRVNLISKSSDTSTGSLLFEKEEEKLLRLLCPKSEELLLGDVVLPTDSISLSQLKTLPFDQQVKNLLLKVKAMHFNQILEYLPASTDVQKALNAVQRVAVLVQGCWVVKNEFLYPKGINSEKTGASSEALSRARNYILYQFSQCQSLKRKEVDEAVKIPNDDLCEILSQIAKRDTDNGWLFILPSDNHFIKEHPQIVEQQAAAWQDRWAELRQYLVQSAASISNRNRTRSSSSKRKRTTSRSISNSDTEEGKKKQRRNSVRIKEEPMLSPPMSNGTTVLVEPTHSSNVNSDLIENELRQFLYEKFSTKPVLSLTEIRKLLELKLTESPQDHALRNGITEQMLIDATLTLGAINYAGATKDANDPIFLYSGGGSWPETRQCLVRFLQVRNKFRFNTFRQQVIVEITDLRPSDDELKRLLQEYCTLKSGIYMLYGT